MFGPLLVTAICDAGYFINFVWLRAPWMWASNLLIILCTASPEANASCPMNFKPHGHLKVEFFLILWKKPMSTAPTIYAKHCNLKERTYQKFTQYPLHFPGLVANRQFLNRVQYLENVPLKSAVLTMICIGGWKSLAVYKNIRCSQGRA